MVINPDSNAAITEETPNTNSASNANHGATSNSAGATPGPKSTGGSQPVTPGGANKPEFSRSQPRLLRARAESAGNLRPPPACV